ncbi:MAG: benzaldehyde dehydrogenase, partial [Nocardioidaceae bacterium]|nr:benzaldehyde dehydrogenase [Nocardioidaceae bacterium]
MILDRDLWQAKVFLGGEWSPASGGVKDVVEPATGDILGEIGLADPTDLAPAAESAAEAQRGWAARPHPERAAVLRRAAQLFAEHAEEISWWNIREVGAIPPMAGFAVHVAEQECYEAASLPGRPYGELLPSEEPRLSMARRVPAGVVGVISPFNV